MAWCNMVAMEPTEGEGRVTVVNTMAARFTGFLWGASVGVNVVTGGSIWMSIILTAAMLTTSVIYILKELDEP